MSEAFETELKPFDPLQGKSFSIGAGPDLILRPMNHCARFSLRIEVKQLKKASTAFIMDIPTGVGAMAWENEKFALCLGPDEWLLLAPEQTSEEIIARFANMAESNLHSLVDVSHRTIGIEISGPLAQLTLNAGCPLDLENMEVDRCTRTVMDKAQIILMKLEEQRYRLEIMRSFAPFVWSFLKKVGREIET